MTNSERSEDGIARIDHITARKRLTARFYDQKRKFPGMTVRLDDYVQQNLWAVMNFDLLKDYDENYKRGI